MRQFKNPCVVTRPDSMPVNASFIRRLLVMGIHFNLNIANYLIELPQRSVTKSSRFAAKVNLLGYIPFLILSTSFLGLPENNVSYLSEIG